jgi:hypothetical protein
MSKNNLSLGLSDFGGQDKLQKSFVETELYDLVKGGTPGKQSGEPITITNRQTGKSMSGMWRTISGNKVFVSGSGQIQIGAQSIRDYADKKSGSDKSTTSKMMNSTKDTGKKPLNDPTREAAAKARAKMDADPSVTDVTGKPGEKIPKEDKKPLDPNTFKTDSGKRIDPDKDPSLSRGVFGDWSAKDHLDASDKVMTAEFRDNVPGGGSMGGKMNMSDSDELSTSHYREYERKTKKELEAKEGKEEVKAAEKTEEAIKKDEVRDPNSFTPEELAASAEPYKKLAASGMAQNSFGTAIYNGYGEAKGLGLKPGDPFLKYLSDNYGKTPGGKKRDIWNSLDAFYKDAKAESLASIKLDPASQSKIDSYQKRIDVADAERKRNNDVNKAVRLKDTEKGDAKLKDMGLSEETISKLRNPDYGSPGIPKFYNQNISGRIKGYKDQIESIKKSAKINNESSDNEGGETSSGAGNKEGKRGKHGIEFTNDTSDERVRLEFDGKPNAATRKELKSNGFKWSPRAGAWQRQNNQNGHMAVDRVISKLEGMDDLYKSTEDPDILKSELSDIFGKLGL